MLLPGQCDEAADKAPVRRRRQQGDTVEKRADQALNLVQTGELSAARHALEGDSIAPGNQQTQRALQDPNRCPAVLRSPLPPAILDQVPEVEFDLSQGGLLANLRSSRRGAVDRPSGTTDHIRAILNSERDSKSFWRMCQEFVIGRLPEEILRPVRTGRMTALQKPQGGIRGIVVGDFVRRLVARAVAQQWGPAVERHTSPFQFALSTKSGCECVAHIAQAMTDLDPNTTLLSVDGIGAFDLTHITRSNVLQGLSEVEGGGSVLPFVKLLYSSPSMYWWTDDAGGTHEVWQGEGGTGRPLDARSIRLWPTPGPRPRQRRVVGFRTFVRSWMTCTCVVALIVLLPFQLLEREMWDRARIQVHQGKTHSGTEAALPLMVGRQ